MGAETEIQTPVKAKLLRSPRQGRVLTCFNHYTYGVTLKLTSLRLFFKYTHIGRKNAKYMNL
jgi:hypothetical protein